MPELLLRNEEDTKLLSESLSTQAAVGTVITLKGALGTGKTTFSRYFIRALIGNDEEVASPTFNLLQTYETPCGPLWHYDLYRIKHPEELVEIGLQEAFTQSIVLIEWPEIAERYLPANRIDITFEYGSTVSERHVRLCGNSAFLSSISSLTVL